MSSFMHSNNEQILLKPQSENISYVYSICLYIRPALIQQTHPHINVHILLTNKYMMIIYDVYPTINVCLYNSIYTTTLDLSTSRPEHRPKKHRELNKSKQKQLAVPDSMEHRICSLLYARLELTSMAILKVRLPKFIYLSPWLLRI